MAKFRNGVHFPINPPCLKDRPPAFADSGEESMRRAAERYNSLRSGVLGSPPRDTPPEPKAPATPDYKPDDAVRGLVSLGVKRHEAERKVRFCPKPWPDDLGEFIALLLRS